MPGAQCTRSRAWCVVNTRVSHRRSPGNHPAFPHAMVLTVCFVLSPAIGYLMHTSLLRVWAETDSLVVVGLAEGGLMSMAIGLGRFGDRRLEKGGPRCMRPWFDGLVRAFDALRGTGRGRFGSRAFCAMTG
jgi:hypothetical protein